MPLCSVLFLRFPPLHPFSPSFFLPSPLPPPPYSGPNAKPCADGPFTVGDKCKLIFAQSLHQGCLQEEPGCAGETPSSKYTVHALSGELLSYKVTSVIIPHFSVTLQCSTADTYLGMHHPVVNLVVTAPIASVNSSY